ncbi:hypothetical protein BD770DRAFT_66178 [Pilaira anomala]|nr:hypothetical protein BD770DRAFT_66178 [Pilaira anomala]
MSRSNNQDDTIVPWDDFSSTQLERAEQFAVRKHELSVNNENDVQNQFVFPSNSSKSALDVFLDDLLSLPTKDTTKLRAPLGDISNKRPIRPNSNSWIKEKDKKRQPTPVLTRMDSLDDNIWTEFDSDLLSLIDVESKRDDESTSSTSPRNTATTTTADPSKVQKKAIDDIFEKKHQNKEVYIPSFTTARGFALPPPSKEAKLKAARILETADKKDDISLSINVDENLFLPPSTTTELKQDLSPMPKDTLSQNDSALSSSSSTSIFKVETITKDEDDFVSIPSYDDVFLPLSFSYKPLPPPGVSQPKTDIPDLETPLSPTYKHNVTETEIEPIMDISKDELPPLPISIDESLFVPQVTEDGHVIKELPTPNGPEAGFQSARSIKPIEKKIENDKVENGQKDKSVFEAKSLIPDELNEIEKPTFMTTSETKSKELGLERDDKIHQKEPVVSELISSPNDISKEIRKPSFMTASGTKLKEPSAEALQKAATLFKDSENPLTYETVINQFGGFQTGNHKKSFEISSQAKRRAISVFSDESEAGIDSKKARFAFPINKNKAINLQNKTTSSNLTNLGIESLPSKRHWEDEEEDNTIYKLQKYNSEAPAQLQKPSFVTAAGNKLKEPSAESVQKAAALFTDAEKTEKYDKVIHQFGGFQMGNSKKSFDISSQAQRKAIRIFNESEETATEAEEAAETIRLSPTPITIKKPGSLGRHVTFSPRKDSTNSSEQNKSAKHVLDTPKKDVTKLDESSNPGSPTGTSSKLSSPIGSPSSKPSSPASLIPKRNISRSSIATRKNKPFKSPIIQSNLELTKAAVHNRATAKAKLTPVFNLEGINVIIIILL